LAGAAIVYGLTLLVLLALENKLLYPAPKYPAGDWTCTYLPHEDVTFASADGTRLHGWLVEHPQPRAVVLYCHGNGDCLGYLGRYLQELRDRQQVTVFAFDYRGYGRSEGSPHEAGILADGQAAQQWLAERMGIKPVEIVLIGRSLGGAVAVDLAATSGARGLVLQSTTTTIPDVAARIMWYLPVRWLMRNRYDSLSKIANYMGPVLLSHGTADSLIPLQLGQKLFAAVPGAAKRMFLIEGGDHNDIEPPEYDAALDDFLQSL
jgi:fermentation-respiration switch protein FrsA (DUF1100 family)